MKNALVALVNLITLLLGITIGILLAPHIEKSAQAKIADPQSAGAAPSQSPSANAPIPIQPGLTVGSIGAYQILSHHIQTDELVVNGLDMLKLQQGEINLLASMGANPQSVQGLIENARSTQLYQVAPRTQPKPPVK